MREVDVCPEFSPNLGMFSKLQAVIKRNGVYLALVCLHTLNCGLCQQVRLLTFQPCNHRIHLDTIRRCL